LTENGFRHITNNTALHTPDDLRGVTMRVPTSALRVATFEKLGATVVAITWSEVYQALSQGVCDGQENPLAQITGAQLFDVQSNLSLSYHIYTPGWICMNLELWNSLSDAQRKVLEDAAALTESGWSGRARFDDAMLQSCKTTGWRSKKRTSISIKMILLPLWGDYAD
jgi:TRAP-type C4-dicarboxylate transport system substrate-binding protein